MSLYANLGYRFQLPGVDRATGSILQSSTLYCDQLANRINRNRGAYSHLTRLLFDPQLYLAELDPNTAPKPCAKLASYPWFAVQGAGRWSDNRGRADDWHKDLEALVLHAWLRGPASDETSIEVAVRECLVFQQQINPEAYIIPGPLTHDAATTFDLELAYLDRGLAVANDLQLRDRPLLATVALSDICLRYSEPEDNRLLTVIADSIAAREVDGVYIVLEQASELANARHCSTIRSAEAILHLIRLFNGDAGLSVTVNFMGVFGLVCSAVGADRWACGWYKSLYRFRLADRAAEGRAYPTYWSRACAADIHLDKDLDLLRQRGSLDAVADQTIASTGLLRALRAGQNVSNVPEWTYRSGNVQTCQEHFIQSLLAMDGELNNLEKSQKLKYVHQWLTQSAGTAQKISGILGATMDTRLNHVDAWLSALEGYMKFHE